MKQHTQWVVDTLQTVPAFASKTFVAMSVRNTKAPYVVVWPADGTDQTTRVTGPAARQRPRFTLHIVGTSYDNAATITAALKEKFIQPDFHGVIPDIPGFLCGRVWWSAPIPIQVNEDVSPALVYQVVEFGFTAEPVPYKVGS